MELLSLDALAIEEEGEVIHGEVRDDVESHDTKTYHHHVDELSDFLDDYIDFCSKYIYELFPRDEDARIADAILELFRKREQISIFNKKALYIYIREIVDVKTPKITKVANELADIYAKFYRHYQEHGYVDFRI